MIKYIMKWIIIMCSMILIPACNVIEHKAPSNKLSEIQEGMTEKEVINILGKPNMIKSQNKMRMLYYTLDDGRKWGIIINQRDETVGSGERMKFF